MHWGLGPGDLVSITAYRDWESDRSQDLDYSNASLLYRPLGGRVLIDGRNIYDREEMERLGFVYWGLGRGMALPVQPGLDDVSP